MPKTRGSWTTRFGFYLVAIGSACGLGNLWRFPYVVGENGGGAFVLLYILLALTVGLPLLIGELMLGKQTGQSILSVTNKLNSLSVTRIFRSIGFLSLLLSLVVLSYYAVISGWVLHFLMQFFFGIFRREGVSNDMLSSLMANGLLQVGLTSIHLLVSLLVIAKGVQQGLEKWIGTMMPLFAFLLLMLMFRSLSLPTGTDALRFIFYPDFSKLTYTSLLSALGHVLFTLSVGFGTMVTFGSYLREDEHVPTAGFRVTLADSFISLLAGLLIFPIFLNASDVPLIDPALLFDSLPRFLAQIPGGTLFGLAFFLCLYTAALGASIGLFEGIVSNLIDQKKGFTRTRASWLTGLIALLFATLPALSSSSLREVRFAGKTILESLDILLINWILPIAALGIAWVMQKSLSKENQAHEFLAANHINSSALYSHWRFAIKYFVPFVILLAFALQLFQLTLKIDS
jgi:NSS family neurotransmitter:Na+ symporter